MCNLKRNKSDLDVAIIGAGIGGASAALAMWRLGQSAELFEQASELREVGGAIIIREPSMALFKQWGILDELRPKMVAIDAIEMRDKDGKINGSMPIEFDDGEGKIAYSVHRADVHGALISALPADSLHLSHRLAEISETDDVVQARFENGASIRAQILIGADGLRSVVRDRLDTTPMTFAKMVTHRAIAPAFLLPDDMPNDRVRMWRFGRLSVILLPVRAGSEVAIDAIIPSDTPPKKLWSSVSDEELLSYYDSFDPLIEKLVKGRTTDVTSHPVYDKDPISRWTNGRVVLMGDAAHPMAPMQGQGANQAIQDAGALATALFGAQSSDRQSALYAYQSARAPVTARLQINSRKPPEKSGSVP